MKKYLVVIFIIAFPKILFSFDPVEFFNSPFSDISIIVPPILITGIEWFEENEIEIIEAIETEKNSPYTASGKQQILDIQTPYYTVTFSIDEDTGELFKKIITISDESLPLKFGITVGMRIEELQKIIGRPHYEKTLDSGLIRNTTNTFDDLYITYFFHEDTVELIEIYAGD